MRHDVSLNNQRKMHLIFIMFIYLYIVNGIHNCLFNYNNALIFLITYIVIYIITIALLHLELLFKNVSNAVIRNL